MNNCEHDNTQFMGYASIMGSYVCQDCGEKIDPVEYHKLKGLPHVNLSKEHNLRAYGANPPAWVYNCFSENE